MAFPCILETRHQYVLYILCLLLDFPSFNKTFCVSLYDMYSISQEINAINQDKKLTCNVQFHIHLIFLNLSYMEMSTIYILFIVYTHRSLFNCNQCARVCKH
jgi:hypothetical protein